MKKLGTGWGGAGGLRVKAQPVVKRGGWQNSKLWGREDGKKGGWGIKDRAQPAVREGGVAE
jgi:hypothetical protein